MSRVPAARRAAFVESAGTGAKYKTLGNHSTGLPHQAADWCDVLTPAFLPAYCFKSPQVVLSISHFMTNFSFLGSEQPEL